MQTTSHKFLAIIIPMYNEELVASTTVDNVIKIMKRLKEKTTLIIINDGSSDSTATILHEKLKLYKEFLVVITHKKNKGYGGAIQTGISFALEKGYDWILHMDSDLTNNPKYIKDFIKATNSNIDCVKASRYIKGGKVVNVPIFRRIISAIGNLIASYLFDVGIKDCTNGFRIVRLSLLKDIHFKQSNFSIILEELYYLKKKGARFSEIPYTLTNRMTSHSHFKYNRQIFYDYFKYAFKALIA